ncbi:hypothetical protein [Calothrix sp. 336/3]|uniref:hypothetical protein n=1 Tax=Calothrix sp. 336/3 TaxID=1337936 RepID=UPI0004E42655|nr:hypothetical protein [Calothrix sp. 336/3]AKG20812.1 hypothetical protein IJ00_05360 [Calothrix sp. 336/3]
MITIDDSDKARIAKIGANKLFDVEYETRQKMSNLELIEVFERAWEKVLENRVNNAEIISSEEVARRLLDKYHGFIDPQQEHRSFHYLKAEFIAQLIKTDSNTYKLTQIWRVASSDTYPKTLFISFSSVEERNRFDELARSLQYTDEELGLLLIRNFMNLHPDYQPDKGVSSDNN